MNDKILNTLEFGRIKDMLGHYLSTAAGQKELNNLRPQADIAKVRHMLEETTDGADILRLVNGLPLPQLDDITTQLQRLKINASLSGTELAQVAKVLQATMAVHNFFMDLKDDEVQLRHLYDIEHSLATIPQVTQRLLQSIDPDGRVKDEASSRLHGIRNEIKATETSIRSTLNDYTHGRDAKYLSEPIVTMRNDRYVIPVIAHYRNRFGGVVHDQSASGQTFYIEPENVVQMNNDLRQLQIDERQEIRQILADLSALLAPYRTDIAQNERILGHLDLINAKAKLAQAMQAELPQVNDQGHIKLIAARHPLIPADKAVANDVELGTKYKTIVITGPNTGGKTVTIKTIGLIQLMGQSGLFIPAHDGSTITVFDDIFADIGDEQSLEQNLSTFSGHMENVKHILDQATSKSLVLLDELGAGTDPKEGAALAMAILDELDRLSSEVVITTHYPELKVYGYEHEQTINASMEFDQKTLRPTYKLLLGIPGQSNGIAIAKRLGLNQQVIADAQSLIEDDSQELNKMIGDLVQQRKEARVHNEQLQKQLHENQVKQADLDKKLARFEENRDHLYDQARSKANHEVAMAKKQADRIIHHLRQMEISQGQAVKENELIDAQGRLNALHKDTPLKHNSVLKRAKNNKQLKPGDAVKVLSYGQEGTLVAKRGKHKWEVQLGILKMEIDSDDLQKISNQQLAAHEEQKQPTKRVRSRAIQTRHTSARLDLRGQRYAPAMANLASFIDHALLNNLPSVTIIHGKGTGAIRKGTQQYLQSLPQVKSFEYASPNNGGDGATIVYFK